jgi:hypothetical protein
MFGRFSQRFRGAPPQGLLMKHFHIAGVTRLGHPKKNFFLDIPA